MNVADELSSSWTLGHTMVLFAGVAITLLIVFSIWVIRRKETQPVSTDDSREETGPDPVERWQAEYYKLTDLAGSLVELNRQISELRHERDDASEKCNKLVRTNEALKSRLEQIIQTHNELVEKHNDLARRFRDQIGKGTPSQEELLIQIQSAQDQNEKLTNQVDKLQTQLQQLLQQNDELGRQNESLESRCQTLNSEKEALANQITSLRRESEDIEHQAEYLSTRSDCLQNELEQSEAQKLLLEQQLQQIAQEKNLAKEELARERQSKSRLQHENNGLVLQIEDWKAKEKELLARDGELTEANQKLKAEIERLRQLNQDLAERNQDLTTRRSSQLASKPSEGSALRTPPHAKDAVSVQQPRYAVAIPRSTGSRRVTIGLDFGTHSTKVMLRARNEEKSHVLFLDRPVPDYPVFAVPSLVRVKSGRLFFGGAALTQSDGVLFRSLKVSLLPPSQKGDWKQGTFPKGTTPDLLVAIYLSWILGRIRDGLGRENASQIALNVAAPMNHLLNSALEDRYLQVLNAAWEATFGENPLTIDQGGELVRLGAQFQHLLEFPVPDRSVRRFEVLPETLAPLVSLAQDPKQQPGFYLMVDMGAGTTEVSVSHVNEQDADHRLLCYADESIRLGGDDFNRNDQENAENLESHRDQEAILRHTLQVTLRKVWHSGFTKDKDAVQSIKYAWRQLYVVLAGGGLRRSSLEQAIREDRIPERVNLVPSDYNVLWHHPSMVEVADDRFRDSMQKDENVLAYLAVAHGLSLERQKWPKFHYPHDVGIIHRARSVQSPYDRSYSESDVG